MKAFYQRAYRIGEYLQEKIGFEMDIPDDGDPIDEIETIKNLCDQAHKKLNPGLYLQQTECQSSDTHVISKSEQVSGIIEAISLCRSSKALEMFRAAMEREKKEFPEIEVTFNKKMEELINV